MNNSYNQTVKNPNFQGNNLLNGFQNYQKNNMPFQNNPLLSNNPHFVNMMNNQQAQMMNLYNNMAKYKQAHEMKKMQKNNDICNIYDKDLIHQSVIKPIKIIKASEQEFKENYNIVSNNWENERVNAWKERTNQPYKNVLHNENYGKFIGNNKIKAEDLIVHRVTDEDKIGIMEELTDLIRIIEKHENELKTIYSLSKETEHKKKFQYVHRDQYRTKYDPKDFDGLKKDQVEYYKREQQKLEKNKKNVLSILESLLNNGILNEEDIKNIEEQEKALDKEDDMDKLEKQLKEFDKKESNNKDKRETKKEKTSNDVKNRETVDKQKKKVTVVTKPKTDTPSVHNKINSNIDDLKQKYMNRQKK